MADARTLQVQAETRGAVPEGALSFAVHRVSSLLRMASEPVLFARVKLTMAADPAVERPAVAQLNIDLNGRLIRAQAGSPDDKRERRDREPGHHQGRGDHPEERPGSGRASRR